jgi:predicted outer membrane repeat protein
VIGSWAELSANIRKQSGSATYVLPLNFTCITKPSEPFAPIEVDAGSIVEIIGDGLITPGPQGKVVLDAANQDQFFVVYGTLHATNIAFKNGKALNGGFGGAIFVASGTANITACAFTNNQAPGDGDGGAIAVSGTALAYISNCIFEGNIAGLGGAIYNVGTTLLTNSSFATSKSEPSGDKGYNSVTNDGCSAVANVTFYCPSGTIEKSASMGRFCGGDQYDCTWPVQQLPPAMDVPVCT